ncbi:MAG: penicillin-binding protein 2 [Nitrospinales bacterium]
MSRSIFDEDISESIRKKVKLFAFIIVILFLCLLTRTWYMQILQEESFSKLSKSNQVRLVSLPSYRGVIKDRNGETLVTVRPSFNLYITPEDAKNIDGTLQQLGTLIEFDINSVKEKIRKSRPFKNVPIKVDISRKEVALVEENNMKFPGVHISVEPMRNYIYKDLAAHVFGYLGEISKDKLAGMKGSDYTMGDLMGKDGLESIFESHLRGKKGSKEIEVDVSGRELKTLRSDLPEKGNQLTLTIDLRIQKVLEEAMTGTSDKPINGTAILMNVKTGEIIAVASKPSFDPNLFAAGISRKDWRDLVSGSEHPLQNKLIDGQYPPGSTYKIVTALAALEEKVVTHDEKIFCPGDFKLGKRRYRCWKKRGHGAVNMYDALVQSCDVYFYTVGHKLGIDRIAKYANLLGLGNATGVNLIGEKSGLIPTSGWKLRARKEKWLAGETISASIGQGYNLVTPIQQVSMMATVAADGLPVRPHFVKKIEDHEGKILKIFPAKPGKQISFKKENMALIKEALLGVVQDLRGTGKRARVKNVEVAGKTGTAQVVGMKKGEQPKDEEIPYMFKDHAWFVSFAPFKDPEVAAAVIIEHGGHGGHTAAPIAKKLIHEYNKYYDLTREEEEETPKKAKKMPAKKPDELKKLAVVSE